MSKSHKQQDYPQLLAEPHEVRQEGRRWLRLSNGSTKKPVEFPHQGYFRVRCQLNELFPKSDFFARGQ